MDKNYHPWRGKRADQWYLKKMTEQTKAAIVKQDEDFEAANKDAPDEVLLEALRERAAELGYGPHPLEVPGNQLIKERFGSWQNALESAGIQKMGPGHHKVEETERYKAEYQHQQKLHREEKAKHKEQKRLEAEAKQKKKLEKQQTPPKRNAPVPDRVPVTAAQEQNGQ